MKVLMLVMKEQRALLDNFYAAIAQHLDDCDVRQLTDDEQADLKKYFVEHVDVAAYSRIVVFIRCKKAFAQRSFFSSIPNLVFLEHDAWQNFADCKYRGKFSQLYRSVPWARIICSGKQHTQSFQSEGLDCIFVPKGYDQKLIQNLRRPRTIELAFVGSTNNAIYYQRKEFLEQLARIEPIEIVRTESGQDYVDKLNTIRYFVSADVGMGEYMIKNFEAMAAGCVLLTYDQGAEENIAFGFEDMVNVVLYRDLKSLREKLAILRSSLELGDRIAAAGQELVEKNFTFETLGAQVANAIRQDLRARTEPQQKSLWSQLKCLIQPRKQ
ncbi:MAG: glycosyltransferase [Spongiibacteraceae bacterium]